MIQDYNDYRLEFKDLQGAIENEKLRKTCDYILKTEDFFLWPGGIGKHHAYKNGLIAHTVEVAHYADEISFIRFNNEVDKDVLLTACLWHDFAKIYDYGLVSLAELEELQKSKNHREKVSYESKDGLKFWIKNDYHQQIHHIAGGFGEFTSQAHKARVDQETIFKIQHCLLSHHGFNREWSLRQPQSLEAVILHHADYLSAAFGKLS